MVWFFFDEKLGSDDEAGDRGLHVRGAAAVELAVAHRGHDRVGMPLGKRAGGHDIRMPREADDRAGATAASPEIRDLAELHRLATEASFAEPGGKQLLAAAVLRGD